MKLLNILYAIIFVVIVYLAFAFGYWDFNAGNWDVLGRIIAVVFMFMAFVFEFFLDDEIHNNLN